MLETVRRPVKTVQHCKGKPLSQSRALRIDIQILLNSKELKQEKTQEETERDKPMEQKIIVQNYESSNCKQVIVETMHKV